MMKLAVLMAVVVACAGMGVSRAADVGGADPRCADVGAIEAWAKRSYFGGATVEAFAAEGRELVVVNGMPTSGVLTAQLVVLGRAGPAAEYRVLLRTATFREPLMVTRDDDALTVEKSGKTVLSIPFELATLAVHPGP